MHYSKKYRVLTLDGFILGHRRNKKEALELAHQQARQLSESIEVQLYTNQGEYKQVTIVMNPAKFVEGASNGI